MLTITMFQVMVAVCTIAVCGDIISYRTDSEGRKFFMEYKVSDDYVLAETQIYVPNKGVQKFKSNYGINKIEISY